MCNCKSYNGKYVKMGEKMLKEKFLILSFFSFVLAGYSKLLPRNVIEIININYKCLYKH